MAHAESPKQEIAEQQRRQQSAARTRVKECLSEWAASEIGRLSAADVGHRLAAGEFNNRALALLLYPQRMAERCWAEPVLAQRLGLKLPAKKTKAAREKFSREIVAQACGEVAPMLETALGGRAKSFASVWREIEAGAQDDLPLALALWPERVVERCAADVTLAEVPGLRNFFWVQHPAAGWHKRLSIDEEVRQEVARRRGTAG